MGIANVIAETKFSTILQIHSAVLALSNLGVQIRSKSYPFTLQLFQADNSFSSCNGAIKSHSLFDLSLPSKSMTEAFLFSRLVFFGRSFRF